MSHINVLSQIDYTTVQERCDRRPSRDTYDPMDDLGLWQIDVFMSNRHGFASGTIAVLTRDWDSYPTTADLRAVLEDGVWTLINVERLTSVHPAGEQFHETIRHGNDGILLDSYVDDTAADAIAYQFPEHVAEPVSRDDDRSYYSCGL